MSAAACPLQVCFMEINMHALAAIEQNMARPMTKTPIPNETYDDRTQGKLKAQEVIGLMIHQHAGWKDQVHGLFTLTVEARKVMSEQLSAWRKACTEGTADLHGMDTKKAKKFVNSASTRISQINTIIKALNGGMTYDTLREAWKCDDPQELSIESVYSTAKEFAGADARGRKPDTLLVKLGKWIEVQKKGMDADASAEDRKVLDDLIQLHNRLVG